MNGVIESMNGVEERKSRKSPLTWEQALEQVKGIMGKPKMPEANSGTHPSPTDLGRLGWSHLKQFRQHGSLNDLEKAVERFAYAVLLTPDGHPDLPLRLMDLGTAFGDQFYRLGGLEDSNKSINYTTLAIVLTPDGHPDIPRRLAGLGLSYNDRYNRLGEVEDLKESINYILRAIKLAPNDDPGLPGWLGSLAASYNDRFKRLGEVEDLERSIEHFSRALALTPGDHPNLSRRHANLGVSYRDRFRRLGNLEDSEKSIEHLSRSLELTPNGHLALPNRLACLGGCYHAISQYQGTIGNLEKAFDCCSCALGLTPDGHPDMPLRLTELGMVYTTRFQRLGEIADLEKAIECDSDALALTPDRHPARSDRLSDLGECYTTRFQRLGRPEDLKQSIEYYSQALALTPDGHPNLSTQYFNLGLSLVSQYQSTSDPSYLNESLSLFRKSFKLSTGAPRDNFQHALRWANLASRHNSLEPIEAYQIAIDLLPQFIWLGATASQRYHDLSITENLPVNAASVAIISMDHSLALEWLEHARCVVWTQSLMLRSPLDILHAIHPDLATRLQKVSDQLHGLGSKTQVFRDLPSNPEHPEQVARQRRHLAKKYQELLAKARQLPHFDDFLRPIRAYNVIGVARHGPIVIINCHEIQCDAIFLFPGNHTISHIPLQGFNQKKAQRALVEMEKSLRLKQLRQRGIEFLHEPVHEDRMGSVLAILWSEIVKPVIDFLEYAEYNCGDNLPHLTWYPTGALSLLPLHAAGDYNKPRSRAFDYVISSYTPTLTALLPSAPSSLSPDCRILAIGQAATPGLNALPGTTEELAYVKTHTEGKAKYSQLIDSQATTTAVLDAMEQHDWVHLACHAHQNVDDPTKSGFFLQDGILDLASINQRSFKNKGLAFLSACQTATGYDKLPDEAIHLASGMLMAGYPSVIATMWSVRDKDAPFVADRVYAQLIKDGKLGNGEAGRALHYAVAALREKVGEKEFGRWVPYIHIGS
ncbi:unnamed protein product [Rhizoctonia solani]|uniref:CHAT domain-containing protein n=1 Tax=Rhizoctonia solani TaxID=456999 RepID=A0A8H3DUR7_9AGAM|nr:unnamed protein product [Rhizoctonia solani]